MTSVGNIRVGRLKLLSALHKPTSDLRNATDSDFGVTNKLGLAGEFTISMNNEDNGPSVDHSTNRPSFAKIIPMG